MKRCSVLRDFVNNIDYNDSLENLKNKSIEYIRQSSMSELDKQKMCKNILYMNSVHELSYYLFNALLKFEGCGVI